MQFDDDDAIEVDEVLDQLTELLFVPRDSPFTHVQRAIPVRPKRPALLILPEEGASIGTRASAAPGVVPRRAGARSMQLTPFAARARQPRAN